MADTHSLSTYEFPRFSSNFSRTSLSDDSEDNALQHTISRATFSDNNDFPAMRRTPSRITYSRAAEKEDEDNSHGIHCLLFLVLVFLLVVGTVTAVVPGWADKYDPRTTLGNVTVNVTVPYTATSTLALAPATFTG